jgi:alkanesulfonate monooxygenase SsuD/methylene tetrahydromethanopterin reductase-like flavin-dependent oxidoreductase (luciferase family)
VADEPSRRQTTLLVGPRPVWIRPPAETATQPIWVIAAAAAGLALAAIFGLGLLYGNWSLGRTTRKAREELPDRVELPPADDAADRSGDPDPRR